MQVFWPWSSLRMSACTVPRTRCLNVAAVALAIALGATSVEGQCEGPGYGGFDFWLGEWSIEQRLLDVANGKWIELPAHTSVEKVLAGCAVLERWRGTVQLSWAGMTEPEPMEGLSIRYWDPEQGLWSIHWIDSLRPVLGPVSVGTIVDGHGTFEPVEKLADGRWSKIVFARRGPARVDWRLEHTADGGATWRTIWEMAMTRQAGE
jgi:hypothetical protein